MRTKETARTVWLRAVLLFVSIICPCTPFASTKAIAAPLTSRSITLSSSTTNASGVNYLVQFTTPSSAQSMVIDFCGDSPIIGASCDTSNSTTTGLPNFTAASATFTNNSGMANWSKTASQFRIRLTKNTGSATTAGGAVSFTLGTVTNMSVARSFYARIYTYGDAAYGGGSPYSSPTSPGGYIDSGGFALSTTAGFTVTARVMESLSFCISGAAPGSSCSGVTAPNVSLGHGSNTLLDSSQVDSASVFAQVSTNAQTGVVIRLKNGSGCIGLSNDGGTTCPIAAQNAGSSSASITPGSGMVGVGVTAGSGMTAATKYTATGGKTNLDPSGATGIASTYGDSIVSSTGPLDSVNSTLNIAATAGPTTPAGSYNASLGLIVTGNY